MINFQQSPSGPSQPITTNANTTSYRWSAIRVAGAYLIVGLLWIGLSDLTLVGAGGLTSNGFRVSAGKGILFVLLSTGFIFWLCRRENRNTLRSMTLLNAVVEGTSDAVFVKDRAGKYLLVNTAAAQFIGKPVAEILGRDDRELFSPNDGERLIQSDRKIMASGGVVTLEETLTSSGTTRTYQATKAPYFEANGSVAGIIGISRNVTDRAQVEATLRETDARLREAQRIARLGSWSWEPPTNRVWWSDAEFELFGRDPTSVRPSFEAFLALLHPDDRKLARDRVDAMLAGADEFANDMRIMRADGKCMWIHSQARATRDEMGNIVRVEGTDQDITGPRLAREAAEDSERRLQAAIEVAQLGIITVNYIQQTADISPRAAEQFGLKPGAASRAEVHARFHPDDRANLLQLIAGALDPSGTGCFALEHRVIRPDGTIRWLNVRKQVYFDDGKPSGAVVVTADVTAQREAEARLREQEMLVREAAELAKVGGWGFDPVTLQADWTSEVAIMYGLPSDAPPALEDALGYFNPDQRPALEAALAAAMKDGQPHDLELQLTAADGQKKWVRTICRPIVEDGRVVRVRGSLQDITDRKRVESDLRASEERYRMLFDSNPHPMWVYDVDSLKFLAVNDAAVLVYGYSREEFLNMTICEIRPAEDVPRLLVSVARTERGLQRSAEWRHRRKDGTVFDVDVSSHDLPQEHGHSRLVLALDINDRKRAESELQASERRLRLALEAAGAIAFVWDIQSDTVTRYFSKEPALPSTTAERMGTLDEVRRRVHPDDLDAFDARLSACLASGTEYRNEYRVIRPDGTSACLEEYGYLDRAPDGAPLRLTGMSIDITARLSAIDSLRTGEERLRVALKGARGGVWDWSLVTGTAWWSPEMYELMGATPGIDTGEPGAMNLIHEDDRQRVRDAIGDAIARRTEYHCEFRVQGGKRWLSSHAHLSCDAAGNPNRLVGITWDITARRQLEEQFRQAQKMEAVGRLAGGVAHDFNNLLTVINGYSELMLADLAVDHPMHEPLTAIHDAGDRAARLTKQLLALSRKSMVEPRLVDLNQLVAESANLLRRLIGEDITLSVLADPAPVRVILDPGQLEQVLMNLVVNARDAMPTGGRLTIETRNVETGDGLISASLGDGRYALLRVTDTGCGIPPDVQDKIFEPFFTTKDVGKGTGLGLAVVHGVVQQSGGSITVDSMEGSGTTFKILLPSAKQTISETVVEEVHSSLRGQETVLVAEDEEAVRTLVRFALEGQGYTVLTAADGTDALQLLRTHSGQIDLLITDMIMPGISGRELAENARKSHPSLRIIYMSGYTDDALVRYGLKGTTDQFIQKPFTPLGLVRNVRSILDQS